MDYYIWHCKGEQQNISKEMLSAFKSGTSDELVTSKYCIVILIVATTFMMPLRLEGVKSNYL